MNKSEREYFYQLGKNAHKSNLPRNPFMHEVFEKLLKENSQVGAHTKKALQFAKGWDFEEYQSTQELLKNI